MMRSPGFFCILAALWLSLVILPNDICWKVFRLLTLQVWRRDVPPSDDARPLAGGVAVFCCLFSSDCRRRQIVSP